MDGILWKIPFVVVYFNAVNVLFYQPVSNIGIIVSFLPLTATLVMKHFNPFYFIFYSCFKSNILMCMFLSLGFLRCFGIRISVQWQYPIKVKDELHFPQKYKSFKPSTPQLPSNMANVSKILAEPPPTPQIPSLLSADFCRAVGGPIAPKSTSHENLSPALSASPVTFLQTCCEMSGIGLPQFEFCGSSDGPDEFLHLTFKVSILGLGVLPGEVTILPGPTATTTIERAREAAAQQLLKSVIGLKVFLR